MDWGRDYRYPQDHSVCADDHRSIKTLVLGNLKSPQLVSPTHPRRVDLLLERVNVVGEKQGGNKACTKWSLAGIANTKGRLGQIVRMNDGMSRCMDSELKEGRPIPNTCTTTPLNNQQEGARTDIHVQLVTGHRLRTTRHRLAI